MGSSGYGAFGNYKQSKKDNLCFNDIEDVSLEEITRLSFYLDHKEVPSLMDEVYVLDKLHNSRIVVISKDTKLEIGYLPTKFNYLLSCLAQGIKYSGNVIFSMNKPIPKVVVNIYAEREKDINNR